MIVFLVIFLLVLLFIFCLKGRTANKGVQMLRGWFYAHRGLHCESVPENSLSAFRLAKESGYGVELDVHLMSDGNLAVIHDSSLQRIAGSNHIVEELDTEKLTQFVLKGNDERIPLFSQVLDLVDGQIPLIVELKTHRSNHAALCETVCNVLADYKGVYCIESFDPRCILWLRKHRPNIIRGQLTENFFRSNNDLPWIFKFCMKHQLLNVITRPDFVAYRHSDRKTISNFICRKIWHVQGVAWTITSQTDLDCVVKEGWIPIFEGFKP